MTPRTTARTFAALVAAALVAGPLAGGAEAAPKRKPPAPVITARPPALTNVRTATFEFTNSQAGVTFECSLDGSAFVACASPKAYTSQLGEATHTFKVRAKDSAGTASVATGATWTIDVTPPAAPALAGTPASPTSATTASFTFSTAEAGATFRCALDGAVASDCSSPFALSNVAHGDHVLTVAVRDAAGNVGAPAVAAWSVDTLPPPAPVITTGPADVTNSTNAVFQVSSPEGGAALTCSLDGAAFAACPAGYAYTALAEAAHTFVVRASDAVGNAADGTAYVWEVDLTAPTPPSIVTAPAAQTKEAVGSFTFNGYDAVTLYCSLDGGAYEACEAASYATPALADGAHTLLVRGVDVAANTSGATPWHWTVDNTPPPAPAVTGPAALTNATTATFAISNTEQLVTYTCALDGGTAAACESGVTYSSLGNGAHALAVTAADGLGNTASATHAWTVDTVTPTVTVAFPTAIDTPATATFSEPVSGVSASSLALRVSGTTTALAAALACADAAAAPVSCAVGPVKSATLAATVPLVPGERYTVAANPGAAATVADAAGNVLTPVTAAFRAQRLLQETSKAAKYSWRTTTTTAAYGGSYRGEHLAGATATYPFTGTSVTWYTVRAKSQGIADVYVDGVLKGRVNNYAATTSYKVARTVSGLANAKHTLKIVVRGLRGSSAGTGTFVAVDAVRVGTAGINGSPTLTTTWRRAAAAAASGGALAFADLGGQEVSLRFRGTAISWYGSTGPNRGIARVYVDGVLKATVDTYAAATAYNVRRTVTGLSDARHTIRIIVTGTRRAASKGNLVAVDRFAVI